MTSHMSGGYAKQPPTFGKVLLHTSIGDLDIELWANETPKTCRNFIQLCMEEYYDNVIFHRVIPEFMAQTGDPNGDGSGGKSIYGAPFKDEFHSRLTFAHRGIVAMANAGVKNENKSQFFIALGACHWLNRKHTIFGKITGKTIFNILQFNDLDVNKENDRPLRPPYILSSEILLNPFTDIQPRMSEKKRIAIANEEKEKKRKKKQEKRKKKYAKKNTLLLSFGDEIEEETDTNLLLQMKEKIVEQKRLKNIEKQNFEQQLMSAANKTNEATENALKHIREKIENNKNKRKLNEKEINDQLLSSEMTNEPLFKKRKLMENEEKPKTVEMEEIVDYEYEDDIDDEVDDKPKHVQNAEKFIIARKEKMEDKNATQRMSKKQRQKYSFNELNKFRDRLSSLAYCNSNEKQKPKKLDLKTGIYFENSGSEEYDPNWMSHNFECKKRPQDIDLFNVDDYVTIHGNNSANIIINRSKKKKRKPRRNKM